MMFKQFFSIFLHARVFLLLASLMVVACNSTGFTKKQRAALDHYADETADAILFSATKVKRLLSSYKNKNGAWPKGRQERRKIFEKIDDVLQEHHISNQKLLEVDNNEVIVEYQLSSKKFKQFPRLLDSWVIVFSSGNRQELEIVSIFPHWFKAQEVSIRTPYSKTQLENLRRKFQLLLKEKLDAHSITLSEIITEES